MQYAVSQHRVVVMINGVEVVVEVSTTGRNSIDPAIVRDYGDRLTESVEDAVFALKREFSEE